MVSKQELLRLYRWALDRADGRLASLLESALAADPLLRRQMQGARIVARLMVRLGAGQGRT